MGQSLTEIAEQLKASQKKVQLIYAFNGVGKTRLSRDFKKLIEVDSNGEESGGDSELSQKNILYYSAFTEDLFYWDNDLSGDEERKLMIHPNAFTKWVFVEQGQEPNIIDNFQRYTSDKLTPKFSTDYSEVRFSLERGGDNNIDNLKISKGEESNFVWSIFYALLKEIGEALEEEGNNTFDNIKYVFIDDPVSSLDDNHLIELAVDVANLIKSSQSELKFIVTTHNPLFYNVLSNEFNNTLRNNATVENQEPFYRPKESQKYRLVKRSDGTFVLSELGRNSPFSYHSFLLSEIKVAIDNDQIKKYHFSFLRNILEKTATFLGYSSWTKLLPKGDHGNPNPFVNRILNLSSHSAHAGEEIGEVEENDKEKLRDLVEFLRSEYKFNQQSE